MCCQEVTSTGSIVAYGEQIDIYTYMGYPEIGVNVLVELILQDYYALVQTTDFNYTCLLSTELM